MIIHDNPEDGIDSMIEGCELLLSIEGPAALDGGLLLLLRVMREQGVSIRNTLAAKK
jgi:hypothetical protein